MRINKITLSSINTLLTIIVKVSIALLLIVFSISFTQNGGIVLLVDTKLSGDIKAQVHTGLSRMRGEESFKIKLSHSGSIKN